MERFVKVMARLPRFEHARDVAANVPEAVEVARRAWVLAQVDSTPASWRGLEEAIDAYLLKLSGAMDDPGGVQ